MQYKNDNSKRHVETFQNDAHRQSAALLDVFVNKSEKAFFSYTVKIEKIVSALYLITDVMDVSLPLTNSLRGESLELLNACYRLLSSGAQMTPVEVTRILVRLEHVISLVQIGRIAHHISDMNADIILYELSRVLELITGDIKSLNEQYSNYRSHGKESQPVISHTVLDDALFDRISQERKMVHMAARFASPIQFNERSPDPKPLNDTKTTFSLTTQGIGNVVKNPKPGNSDTHNFSKPTIKTTSKNSGGDKDRKQEIINVIKSHNNATMNDILKFVPDWSEKTLQREIVNLIQLGVILKKGDKRWATYHLNP